MKSMRIVVVDPDQADGPGVMEMNGTLYIRVLANQNWQDDVTAAVRALADWALKRAGHNDPAGCASEVAATLAVELTNAETSNPANGEERHAL